MKKESTTEEFTPNDEDILGISEGGNHVKWVEENTAILVVHGVGNQLPLETLDQFGRGLIDIYRKEYGDCMEISHHVIDKEDSRGGFWFDNVLRIKKAGRSSYIDLYEYYWANYAEDKASWRDINSWVQGVAKGAKQFYKQNAALGRQYKDKSPFFDTKTGEFNSFKYRLFLTFVSKILLGLDALIRGFIWIISRIPLLGGIADTLLKRYYENAISGLTNIIGDVVVYNVTDPKSKFYDVKKRIQEGAVKALQDLLQKKEEGKDNYDKVLVVGHSLGSQIGYDAINRINLLINQDKLKGYSPNGVNDRTGKPISEHLTGFITFGSPLDKIMFFFRENVSDEQYIRQQFLDHFNGFKQRNTNFLNNSGSNKNYVKANSGLRRHLEEIKWRNYYDGRDYISGGLDFYRNLTNVDCHFKSTRFSFTHSDYWNYPTFYKDIIINFLNKSYGIKRTA